MPRELQATRVTEADITLEWETPPSQTRIDLYRIRVNEIGEMDHDSIERPTQPEKRMNIVKSYRVSGLITAFNVTGLKPFTLYNISMISSNINGKSLPTYALQVMTHPLNKGI
jgi:hypothetical protein